MKKIILAVILLSFTACNQEIMPENDSVEAKSETISSFSTPIRDKDEERVHNIKLACEAVNGRTVNPGEEFSFNDTVGVRSPEKGYQKAKIFEGTEMTEDWGGGICQVSSTIYNAAMQAGFEITERHQHEREVTYIELGKDATVDFGTQDLKFRNTLEQTIRIDVSVGENDVTVAVDTL